MRLRHGFLAATLLSCGVRAVPADAAPLAFVLNSAGASISEIDADTMQEVRRLPVLREPHHMALSPDGRSLVVGDTAGNALIFLDPDTGAMQRRIAVSDPYQLFYSPDGRFLTVAGLARNQVDIYDASDYRLLHRVPAPAMPSHMNYSPDSAVVYVSLQDTNALVAIDTATGAVRWNRHVCETPAGGRWAARRGRGGVGPPLRPPPPPPCPRSAAERGPRRTARGPSAP